MARRDSLAQVPPTHHRFLDGQREETYPAPYPTGWYRLCASDDLATGQVIAIDCLGKNLVAYRGEESGKVVVLDAHCPHQGASLAAGGKVVGDRITCPFHGWCFGAEGKLCSVPGLERVPRTGVRRHPVAEHYGMVWMFHHVSGEIVEPPYAPLLHPDIEDGTLRYRGRHDAGEVRMHISEFAENSVDFQHFDVVHGNLTIPWTQVAVPGFGIQHKPCWYEDPEDTHIAYFEDQACVKVRGTAYPKSGAHARITLFGPGGMVWFRFTLPDLGQVLLFQTHLPTAPLRQRVQFRWYADRKIPRPLVWWVVGHWMSQWRADIAIWENKVFRERPVLVSLDGPVHRMRRWYQQFYQGHDSTTGRPDPDDALDDPTAPLIAKLGELR
jgi:cholesterol 7-dehydrogenase